MDYISDKELFKAVMFAKKMIRDGTRIDIAIYRAATYYGYYQMQLIIQDNVEGEQMLKQNKEIKNKYKKGVPEGEVEKWLNG